MAGERLPTFPKNTDYATACTSLIAIEWQPVKAPDAQPCDDDDRCNGRPEMLACAGTGMGNCTFLWRRAETLIEVGTVRDLPPVAAGMRCRANCPLAHCTLRDRHRAFVHPVHGSLHERGRGRRIAGSPPPATLIDTGLDMPVGVDRYLADTAHLTLEEQGVHFRLQIYAWRSPSCCLPDVRRWRSTGGQWPLARCTEPPDDPRTKVLEAILAEFDLSHSARANLTLLAGTGR